MSVDRPGRDQGWDSAARDETEAERLDRNWASLLQELRVTQTGVQLLTGFLLTLPFQQRFVALSDVMRFVYLATVASSIAATVLLVAPVGLHRFLFRRHRLVTLVSLAHRCAIAGLCLLGAALCGVAVVVFDATAGQGPAWAAGGCTLVGLAACWVVIPLAARRGSGTGEDSERD